MGKILSGGSVVNGRRGRTHGFASPLSRGQTCVSALISCGISACR